MRRTIWALACVSACFGATPALAPAQTSLAPPGASGVDEYLETIPEAGGNRPIQGSGTSKSALTATQRHQLERLGPDGRAAAALAEATGPTPQSPGKTSTPGGKTSASSGQVLPQSGDGPNASGDSGFFATLTRSFGGSGGGLGAALPTLLLVSALAVAVLGVRRRRPT
jgi:hypothetical protein